MASVFWKLAPLPLIVLCASVCLAQGLLSGKVMGTDGKPLAGVTILVTNQTSTKQFEKRTQTDGSYAFRLSQGAYSVKVAAPYEARFDRGKLGDIGQYAQAICDDTKKMCTVLENVVMDGDHKLDFIAVQPDKDQKPAEGDVAKPTGPERREVLDRWRYNFPEYDRYGDKGARGRDIPFRRNNRWFNPYDRNVLKGDYPIIGNDYFMILTGTSTTGVELVRTPSGNNVSSQSPNSNNFFGRPEKFALNETLQFSFEFFKGETVFKPRSWAIKISPTFSLPNYLNARERGIVNVDVRKGTTRTDYQISLEDAFFEYKIANTDKNYDFVSVRTGIQPFNADFRGFLFSDNNLGTRLFGGFDNNKFQFNVAYFRQIEKDTNSGLNSMRQLRPQNIYIANLYKQDFLAHGYTIQIVGALNDDRASRHLDENGFVVR
ncbi:MAG TPA: carboxypeptidase-like regulatory domain-containing protein, partial [Pyrinomonadaceae bacterium]